ncbi:MAG: hypothetical protein CEN91_445 [Candidatus Berkelbacteria bacterium Licking1014_85]|uniref:Uncharacterized protein n=1 Tax=Candidatus Berkelbacteria bacterium Licking1014_85 TaxID=2017148 RepID=A0A554LHT3_9BACT|nr:MAG: hypothetical protein CEN91_445 [Candidatus Berkelbacteria bacterium Licking1014_85]
MRPGGESNSRILVLQTNALPLSNQAGVYNGFKSTPPLQRRGG